jgi:hypothetical protein
MARWLSLTFLASVALVIGLVTPADAQVFKPKGKKADSAEKSSSAPKKKKKKKKGSKSKKTSAAAERSRPDDLTPEPESKKGDSDFVKITDDDEIE